MLTAEDLDLTSASIREQAATSADPGVRRLAGRVGGLGEFLSLDPAWAGNIVAQAGNHGNGFRRDLGPLGADRGHDRSWREGGIMVASRLR